MATVTYRLRRAGSRLPAPVKRLPKAVWGAWGAFVTRAFSRYYYTKAPRTWKNTFFLGVPLWKNPSDLWIYQEILWDVKPDLIIETGTNQGGSALYFARLCDLIGNGRVITIDIMARKNRPEHPRIEYLIGSSISPEILAHVATAAASASSVLVALDSDHHRDHVLAELRSYHAFVTPNSYLCVEDSNINGHPVNPFFGPGPMEAIGEFLAEQPAFQSDREREKFMHTFNPKGYLRRTR